MQGEERFCGDPCSFAIMRKHNLLRSFAIKQVKLKDPAIIVWNPNFVSENYV